MLHLQNPSLRDKAGTSDISSLRYSFGYACLTLKIRFEIWQAVINGESTWIVLFVLLIDEFQNITGSLRNWGCGGAIFLAGAPECFEVLPAACTRIKSYSRKTNRWRNSSSLYQQDQDVCA